MNESAQDVLRAIVDAAESPDRRSDKIDYTNAVLDLDLITRAKSALEVAPKDGQACPNVVSGKEGTQYCALAESSVAALRKERDELQNWKDCALLIESRWDRQKVGKLLGLTLGMDIGPNIEPKIRELIADRDRYGKALDNVGAMASHLFYELHGRKMDGPHNRTEVVLLDISTTCTAALNGEENPRA